MNTRRKRFSLSLVQKSDSPVGDRTRSWTSEHNISTDSGCSTPLNTRKRVSSLKCGSPVPYECDHSPIPMSQDASNLISGVSWAWNSPKRAIVNDCRHTKPLSNSNNISSKEPELSRTYRKRASNKLTGFYRFQSELKLLQENHESFEVKKSMSCSSMQVVPPTSSQTFLDGDNLPLGKNANKKTSAKEHRRESLIARCSDASDSFNNSDFDNLLLQASQAVERDGSTNDKHDVEKPLSCRSAQVVLLTSSPTYPEASKLQHKKTKRHESFIVKSTLGPDQSDSFNNTNIDNLLLQASQAVEKPFNAAVILPTRSNLTPGIVEKEPEKRKKFCKSRTTDNFDTNSDGSFPDSELELILQHVVLPETSKINSERVLCSKDQDIHSTDSLRNRNVLTRHKSMPESPNHKILNSKSRNSNTNWDMKTGAQFPISKCSSSNGSAILVPNENDMVIALSSGNTSLENSRTTAFARICSKEEIELKRQEALKRQTSRLKRLMQGNHSQNEATLFKSKLK